MFTFFVCLSVLLGAIACVLVLLRDAIAPVAKPATDPRTPSRAIEPEPQPVAEAPTAELATIPTRTRVEIVASSPREGAWRPAEGVVEDRGVVARARSALNLAILLAALGAGLAVAIAVVALGLQVLLQRAAGV